MIVVAAFSLVSQRRWLIIVNFSCPIRNESVSAFLLSLTYHAAELGLATDVCVPKAIIKMKAFM